MIDLHCHSTHSDGTLSPAQLVARAAGLGLTALALTDHDGTDGVQPLLDACAALPPDRPLTGVPGVEISIDSPIGSLHLLGYFIDCGHAPLQEALTRIRSGREERNARIIERLQSLKLDVTREAAAAYAGSDVVGRPHIAAALVASGYAKDPQQAFDRWLGKGRPAYFDRWRLHEGDALALIRAAGGVPVVAHPFSLKLSARALRTALGKMKKMGLMGLEVYYPLHTPDQEGLFLAITRDLDLVATGGSDFHGNANTALELGRGFGRLDVPDTVVDDLRRRAA